MLFWYDHGVGGWGWFAMSAGMILFWALIITFGVLLYRALARPRGSSDRADARPPGPSPEQFLAERFARGEIDEDEYHRRLTVLRETTECGPRPSQR
ncbi:SHOCT domain-containing protein [Streptomyces sp. NBC_00365]|jgi:putative membrane protein|uniref:SHOCT domain-containing protein n=1 Tax=Streptomyces sp. NBC_00365 TaxID=2975726 RepID=UPI00225C1078|nr:SHOCT domain-containing protein [Streptomyces sp. NBC_00365]MCX5095976.1 SHOCT domain-containing protein [Streptomyces sp. NBC_00365]